LGRAEETGVAATLGIELEFTLFDETSLTLEQQGFENPVTATRHGSHDLVIYQLHVRSFFDQDDG